MPTTKPRQLGNRHIFLCYDDLKTDIKSSMVVGHVSFPVLLRANIEGLGITNNRNLIELIDMVKAPGLKRNVAKIQKRQATLHPLVLILRPTEPHARNESNIKRSEGGGGATETWSFRTVDI